MLVLVDELMSIGEFSERSGLSPKRLRSYAAGGLLVPAAVDASSGYRYYAPGQLRDAKLIDALRAAGMPLSAVGSLLDQPSTGRLDAWARHVEVDAVQKRDALDLARSLLAADVEPHGPIADQRSGKGAMPRLNTAVRTDVGRQRDTNEDVALAHERLALVTDGMGGHPGGDVASALAAELVQAAFTGRSLDELRAGVRAANRAVWDRARRSEELEGMGTTLCAVGLTDDAHLSVVNVGDSRAYLLRDKVLRQLTDDHSVTGELVRRGELTEAEAREHPHRRVLTRVLGVRPDVDADGRAEAAINGDRLLVCSDGLFNEVADDEIGALMTTAPDVIAAADALIALALSNGGRDNVSVVVADVVS